MQLKTEDNRLPQDAIWLDAYRLSDEEREWLTDVILKDVPEEEELDDIEASSRFFLDSDGIHILSLFPQRVDQRDHRRQRLLHPEGKAPHQLP